MKDKDIKNKIYDAINTVENLKNSIFEDHAVWCVETKRSINNVINRLNDYLNLLDIKSDLEKELKEYKDPRMTVLERLEGELGAYVTMPRGITKVIDKIYQTKTGEFLWQIVRGQTGGLDRLGEIMNTNGLQTLNDKLPEVIRIGNK